MKHTLSFIAIALLSMSAHATPPEKAPTAIAGAKGGSAKVVNKITITPTFGAPVAAASLSASAKEATSSAAPALGAQTLIGGTVYERSAPPVHVAAPNQPLTSCRLGLTGGGSNTSRALGFGLVMGNDATCLVGAKLAVMDRVGGFSDEEKRQVACEVEGMEKLATCKRVAEKAPAVARVEPLLP